MMDRSFRAQETRRQLPVHQRQVKNLGTGIKEKEEELALFLEMRKREKERNSLLLQAPEELDTPLGLKVGSSPVFKMMPSPPPRRTAADDFLNSEGEKTDYDWLLTPPGTPLFPSLEAELNKSTLMSQIGTPKSRPTILRSRLGSPQTEPVSKGNVVTRPNSSSGLSSPSSGTRRPSSSGGPGMGGSRVSRPPTPTRRPGAPSLSKSSRPATPSSRPSLSSSKPTVPPTRTSATAPRSSTPTSTAATRSSMNGTLAMPALKSVSRSTTPVRRPSAPSSGLKSTGPPWRSSSVSKIAPPKDPSQIRGTSLTVKSRPWKPSDMPGFSLDAPPNLRTSIPDRPHSASRGRPGGPASRSSSVEPSPNGKPKRQSCSPTRGRVSNGNIHRSGSTGSLVNKSRLNNSDNPSPVLVGTRMVERVINMRKLAPPKSDDQQHFGHSPAGKSSSPDSSGFGRTLSKKSLDMALRHMEIRSIPGNLRSLMANIPASSMYSVKVGPTKRTVSVSGSPVATSSNCSSDQSICNNRLRMDGSEVEDDLGSERGGYSSSSSQCAR